jgi:hypothetical protein
VKPLGWQDRARCAGTDNEVFFPDGGDTRRAKAFCAGCKVWSDCLLYGLEEDHGVWGGLNRAERARLRRLRARLDLAPTDPNNAVDIKRLVSVGLSSERLSQLCGLAPETIECAVADDDSLSLSPETESLLPPLPMPRRSRRTSPVAIGA